jgi:hypothetical protein
MFITWFLAEVFLSTFPCANLPQTENNTHKQNNKKEAETTFLPHLRKYVLSQHTLKHNWSIALQETHPKLKIFKKAL